MADLEKTYGHLLTLNVSKLTEKIESEITIKDFVSLYLKTHNIDEDSLCKYEKFNLYRRVLRTVKFLSNQNLVKIKKATSEIDVPYYLIQKTA